MQVCTKVNNSQNVGMLHSDFRKKTRTATPIDLRAPFITKSHGRDYRAMLDNHDVAAGYTHLSGGIIAMKNILKNNLIGRQHACRGGAVGAVPS